MTAITRTKGGFLEHGLDLRVVVPPVLVLCSVLFNFFLCFVNTNFVSITPGPIIAVEMFIIGCGILYSFHRINFANIYWLYVIALLAIIVLSVSLAKGQIAFKPMRDVLIMPVFVALGLSARNMKVTRLLIGLSIFITFIALLEAFWADRFLSIFNFKSYFISKGAMEDLTWLPMNTFASGMRPGGRFLFDLPGVHRISSVFLEPVSLGFYGFISGLYFIAAKKRMPLLTFAAGISLSFILIWLSDGRMALGCLFYALVLRKAFVHTHQYFQILIFPLIFLFAYIIDVNELMDISGEGMGARFHSTFLSLSQLDFGLLLGGRGSAQVFTADSGIAYIIANLGLLGALLYWLAPIISVKKISPEARIYIAGMAFFISFGFMVSAAIYSIKTAALLWFLLGYFLIKNFDEDQPYADQRSGN